MNYRYKALVMATALLAVLPGTVLFGLLQGPDAGLASTEAALLPENEAEARLTSHNETIPDTSAKSDTASVHESIQNQPRKTIIPPDTTRVEEASFARITLSHPGLRVKRNGKPVDITEDTNLLPGDELETCARHFAVIEFHPAGTMILYPASKVIFDPDGSYLALKSAEILYENGTGESSFPDIVHCFDDSLYQNHDTLPVSFGIHCRGESGMILTSKSGTMWWSCKGAPCEVLAGEGLMGRITTANYSTITPPSQPNITTAYVVPRIITDNPETGRQDKIDYSATIMWNPVAMADQYLVHIYQDNDDRSHQTITLHHRNQITTDLPGPGSYIARIMAVDYYGVSGVWSDPLSFTAQPHSEDEYPDLEPESPQPEDTLSPNQGETAGSFNIMNM